MKKHTLAAITIALISLATSQAEKVSANDLSGKWHVIGSSSIPFQDGSVEFAPEGKMITSWSATTSRPADVVITHYKFIEPNIIEYTKTFDSNTYRFIVSRSDSWLTLKVEGKKTYFVLDRKPRT
jgi:hypothetical protein